MTTEQDMERVREDYERSISHDDREILDKIAPVLSDAELDYLCQRLNSSYRREDATAH